MRLRLGIAAVVAALLISLVVTSRAADTLPSRLSDSEYWKMVSEFSEPDGYFQLEIVTSNEISYQSVLPQLAKTGRTGGAYLGVGPEQNFTYIAALQPQIAFLIDIRRDMMLEHLMYKAVFEISADRADFVSNLFSRKRPDGLNDETPVRRMFEAYAAVAADADLAQTHLKAIMSRLKADRSFPLTAQDESTIRRIYMTFMREGVLRFSSSYASPGYAGLMTLTDGFGKNWSFLATKENYDRVRAMHQKNLIVPLVGDFTGPKALRMTGQYVREHGATVNAFYISNVEDYIQHAWPAYLRNIASLPTDSSSTFIRWAIGQYTSLASISNFVRAQQVPAK